jgi:hypothetical protein
MTKCKLRFTHCGHELWYTKPSVAEGKWHTSPQHAFIFESAADANSVAAGYALGATAAIIPVHN